MSDVFKTHGAFSWTELVTNDAESACKFYSGLFGWETEKASMEGMDYHIVKIDGKQMAGVMNMPPEAKGSPPMWGSYITVDDCDATAKKATELGAKVLYPPTDIPGVGRFAVIQDPQGALISFIKYVDPQ